jgi:hypothetical protein
VISSAMQNPAAPRLERTNMSVIDPVSAAKTPSPETHATVKPSYDL